MRFQDTLEDIDEDLGLLEEKGFTYVFIDKVTVMSKVIGIVSEGPTDYAS